MLLMLDDLYTTAPWDQLDAVVFDVGNVLVRFSPEQVLTELFHGQDALQARLMGRVFKTPYWIMLDHGIITYDEALEAMTGRESDLRPSIRLILQNWQDLKHTIPEGVETLRAVKAHGKKAYVLSNYHTDAFAYIEKKYDFFSLFDGKVISARVGLLKPDPAIFRRLTECYGLQPTRSLFIDDTPVNVEAAMTLGWQGICYNEPGKLSRFFGVNA